MEKDKKDWEKRQRDFKDHCEASKLNPIQEWK